MEIKEHAITRPDGATIVTKTTVITGKGQQYFINLFLKGGNANG
jgi:anti-repressor protein